MLTFPDNLEHSKLLVMFFLRRFGIEIISTYALEPIFQTPWSRENDFCQKLTFLKRIIQNGFDKPRSIWPLDCI